MNFDTNTKLNIILAILAIILVLAMILVFRGTGEGYEVDDLYGLQGIPAVGFHMMPDGTIMRDERYAVTCPSSNAACNATMCAICKANQNNPDYYGKGGCAVCA